MVVAIEMITYNHESYIRQAIESVMTQKTDFSFCLYIFEDCSTDNTANICKELKDKYPDKIYLNLNKINLGIRTNARLLHAASYNSGAKYIAMCEGDDYWIDDQKLQKQISMMEAHPDLAITSHGAYRLTDILTLVDNPFENDSFWSTKDAISDKWFMMTSSLVWRKSMANFTEPWLSNVTCADHAMILLASLKGNGYHFKDPMSVYRVHPGGMTNSFTSKDTINYIYLFKIINKISNFKFDKEIKIRIEQLRLVLIRDYYSHNQRIGPANKFFWVNIVYSLRYIKVNEISSAAKLTLQSIRTYLLRSSQ